MVKTKTKTKTKKQGITRKKHYRHRSDKDINAIIEINAIKNNIDFLKHKAGTDIMPVLKADAYGHGFIEMAKILRKIGIKYLGVATLDEAITLRKNGDKGRVLAWLYDVDGIELINAFNMDIDIAICDEKTIPKFIKLIPKNEITLGWFGVSGSMRHLYNLSPILKELSKDLSFELLVISNVDFICKGVKVKNIQWDLNRENEYLNLIDIGLMPLDDSIWTQGKCGYKLIQYGSVGIPSVGSSVGINNEIILNGKTGYLAGNKDEWIKYLSFLIKNVDLRKKMGAEARIQILRNFSLGAYAKQYAKIIKKLSKK